MVISVLNFSNGLVDDGALQSAIRAVNRQISEDFQPYWGFGAQLRLDATLQRRSAKIKNSELRGDAVLYIRVSPRNAADEGFHTSTFGGVPYGFVYLDVSAKLGDEWTITLSHEALELLADPELNLLVQGPHPTRPRRQVFHWFEMCDAVQDENYLVDGVRVSNFVLPPYFTSSRERGGRNDFLGTKVKGKTLRSFGVNPGGYINFFDPVKRKNDNFEVDDRGRRRRRIKQTLGVGRGQTRKRRGQGISR
jgi:hypothetical protein